jgi:predicted O-methyltransferase YrrM
MSEEYTSSYLSNGLDFGTVFDLLIFLNRPTRIVEFGILKGFSLNKMLTALKKYNIKNYQLNAYDIFDKFNGNHADLNELQQKFKDNGLTIAELDFYQGYKKYENNSIDLLHIDIANDGDVYEFAMDHYYSKLSKGGLLVFEGGSHERDQVCWMTKYNKRPINPYLDKLISDGYEISLIKEFPSLTILRKK